MIIQKHGRVVFEDRHIVEISGFKVQCTAVEGEKPCAEQLLDYVMEAYVYTGVMPPRVTDCEIVGDLEK